MERKGITRYNALQPHSSAELWGIQDDLSVHDLDSVCDSDGGDGGDSGSNAILSLKLFSDGSILKLCGGILLLMVGLAARIFVYIFIEKDHPSYKNLRSDIEVIRGNHTHSSHVYEGLNGTGT